MCTGYVLEINKIDTGIIIVTHVENCKYVMRSVIPTGASQEGDLHENTKIFWVRH